MGPRFLSLFFRVLRCLLWTVEALQSMDSVKANVFLCQAGRLLLLMRVDTLTPTVHPRLLRAIVKTTGPGLLDVVDFCNRLKGSPLQAE